MTDQTPRTSQETAKVLREWLDGGFTCADDMTHPCNFTPDEAARAACRLDAEHDPACPREAARSLLDLVERLQQEKERHERDTTQANAIYEATMAALSGEEISDFMASFPLPRKAWDVATERAQNIAAVEKLIESVEQLQQEKAALEVDNARRQREGFRMNEALLIGADKVAQLEQSQAALTEALKATAKIARERRQKLVSIRARFLRCEAEGLCYQCQKPRINARSKRVCERCRLMRNAARTKRRTHKRAERAAGRQTVWPPN